MRSSSSNVSFKAFVSLLLCEWAVCWWKWGVKAPPLLLCYCQFLLLWLLVFALYTFMLLCSVQFSQGIYIYNCYIFSLDWSLDHYVVSFFVSYNCLLNSILSDISIAIPAFFWFPFVWNNFSHPYIFNLCMSLGLRWVSCRQHIYRSCFCTNAASLGLLVGAFNPFTFKVIIDMYDPITIFLIVLSLFSDGRDFPSLVFCIENFL